MQVIHRILTHTPHTVVLTRLERAGAILHTEHIIPYSHVDSSKTRPSISQSHIPQGSHEYNTNIRQQTLSTGRRRNSQAC